MLNAIISCSSRQILLIALIKLGFSIEETIKVPSYRSDIKHQNDLAEELARVIGYDNIPKSNLKLKPITSDLIYSNEYLLKEFLINKGFMETINYPFCLASNSNSIKVDNPLDSNREFIRTNLIDSLIENLIYNEKRQKDSIKFFELSDVYSFQNGIKKDKTLAIIVSGRRGQNYLDFSKKLDSKYLNDLFKEINVDIEEFIINLDRDKIDSKIKTPIYAIEIKLNDLARPKFLNKSIYPSKSLNNFIKYKPISEFPSSFRDLSFSVKDSSKIEEVILILSNYKSDLIKNSYMFDFYENKNSGESKIGFRFIFQSQNRTLKDIEIDKEINEILNSVLHINSVLLPKAQ